MQGSGDRLFDPIVEAIEVNVATDMWETMGGPATISAVSTGKKRILVVSVTPLVHWQVEAFLNQLNGAE